MDLSTVPMEMRPLISLIVNGVIPLMLFCLPPLLILIVSQWKIYKKAGKKGWECIVPIYNTIVLLQIVELPMWYIILFFIPFANIYATFRMYIELAHKFGKSTGFGVATVFFNIICFPILAFGKNNTYKGKNINQITPNNVAPQPSPIGTVTLPNQTNNMEQNNSNTQAPFMFDQNINTTINQIQEPSVNQSVVNPSVNSIPQPEATNTQTINQTPQMVESQIDTNTIALQPQVPVNNLNNSIVKEQPEAAPQENVFKYEIPPPVLNQESQITESQPNVNLVNQPETLLHPQTPINDVSNTVNQVQNTTFTTPTFVSNLDTANTLPTMENNQIEPSSVNVGQSINVIPGMGATPQPEMPLHNTGNNQNNQTM